MTINIFAYSRFIRKYEYNFIHPSLTAERDVGMTDEEIEMMQLGQMEEYLNIQAEALISKSKEAQALNEKHTKAPASTEPKLSKTSTDTKPPLKHESTETFQDL